MKMVGDNAEVLRCWLRKLGQLHGIEVGREVEQIWIDLFKDYDPGEIEIGFREVVCLVKTFPVPAHLMDTSPLRAANIRKGFEKISRGESTEGLEARVTEPDWLRIGTSQ